jgi:hypothetical protein
MTPMALSSKPADRCRAASCTMTVLAFITAIALMVVGFASPASAQAVPNTNNAVASVSRTGQAVPAPAGGVIEVASCRKHACRAAPSKTTALEVLFVNVLARQGQRTVVICAESASGPAVAGGDPVNGSDPSGENDGGLALQQQRNNYVEYCHANEYASACGSCPPSVSNIDCAVMTWDPAYAAIAGTYNAYEAAQDPCSSNWTIAGDSFEALLGVVATVGVATGVAGSVDAAIGGAAADGGAGVAGGNAAANPLGGADNCVACAVAGDARLAGNAASALNVEPQLQSVIETNLGGRFAPVSGPSEVVAILEEEGPGARGIVWGSRGAGAIGHVFNAVNQDGVVRFIDFQSGGAAQFENQSFKSFDFLLTNGGS